MAYTFGNSGGATFSTTMQLTETAAMTGKRTSAVAAGSSGTPATRQTGQ
jgi:hypothetical protein